MENARAEFLGSLVVGYFGEQISSYVRLLSQMNRNWKTMRRRLSSVHLSQPGPIDESEPEKRRTRPGEQAIRERVVGDGDSVGRSGLGATDRLVW